MIFHAKVGNGGINNVDMQLYAKFDQNIPCGSRLIVLPRSNGYGYICLFVNIEIKTFCRHIQKSGVVLKTMCCQPG